VKNKRASKKGPVPEAGQGQSYPPDRQGEGRKGPIILEGLARHRINGRERGKEKTYSRLSNRAGQNKILGKRGEGEKK